jgi:hypothetical protein
MVSAHSVLRLRSRPSGLGLPRPYAFCRDAAALRLYKRRVRVTSRSGATYIRPGAKDHYCASWSHFYRREAAYLSEGVAPRARFRWMGCGCRSPHADFWREEAAPQGKPDTVSPPETLNTVLAALQGGTPNSLLYYFYVREIASFHSQ